MLEAIGMNDRYKMWIDEVSEIFGGLEVCALELVVGKDGREHIIELNDSATSFMGDTQEEDRRHLAELVLQRMQAVCRPGITKTASRSSVSGSGAASPEERGPGVVPGGPPSAPPPAPLASGASIDRPLPPIPAEPAQPPPPPLARRDSQVSQSSTVSSASAAPSTASSSAQGAAPPTSGSAGGRGGFARQGSLSAALTEDAEDTMKNLRKTFAGIFGDM
ncbi:Synapsin [Papilio machaon]|uniref:Synapsin n=1 Tax=Papilio machaon TaxID=76193 RepID=A0A194R0V0_PAPMA|nr:Synapsin [Papilio machaon]